MEHEDQQALLRLIARHVGDTRQADAFIADAIEEGFLDASQHTDSAAWDTACQAEGAR